MESEYPLITCNDFGCSVYYLSKPLLLRIHVVKGYSPYLFEGSLGFSAPISECDDRHAPTDFIA
jgi:hypothetical protein